MDERALVNGLLWFIAFLFSTTVHEAMHAFVAYRGGDPTAYLGGQVSLSPLPHIRREPIGMLVVPLLTAFTNGWALGWASTPYDPLWAARHPRRAASMAAAGPARPCRGHRQPGAVDVRPADRVAGVPDRRVADRQSAHPARPPGRSLRFRLTPGLRWGSQGGRRDDDRDSASGRDGQRRGRGGAGGRRARDLGLGRARDRKSVGEGKRVG